MSHQHRSGREGERKRKERKKGKKQGYINQTGKQKEKN
jgi:hypothetical protein